MKELISEMVAFRQAEASLIAKGTGKGNDQQMD